MLCGALLHLWQQQLDCCCRCRWLYAAKNAHFDPPALAALGTDAAAANINAMTEVNAELADLLAATMVAAAAGATIPVHVEAHVVYVALVA